MKKVYVCRYGFWCMALLISVLIFGFSAQTGVTSADISSGLSVTLLRWLHPQFDQLSVSEQLALLESFHIPLRKFAHFAIYTLLGLCHAGAMYTYCLHRPKAAGIAFLLTVLRAIADEIHQAFVPGRGPGVGDVCIDAAGALLGIGILTFFYYIYVRRSKKKKQAL